MPFGSRTASGATSWLSPELYNPERFGISEYPKTKKFNCSSPGVIVYEVSVNVITDLPWKRWTYIPSGSSRKRTLLKHCEQRSNGKHNREGGRPQKPETVECLGFTKELWRNSSSIIDTSTRLDTRSAPSHSNHATRFLEKVSWCGLSDGTYGDEADLVGWKLRWTQRPKITQERSDAGPIHPGSCRGSPSSVYRLGTDLCSAPT